MCTKCTFLVLLFVVSNGWQDVCAQLGRVTLSVWGIQKIEEANKQEEKASMYINITDVVCIERLFLTCFLF